nr:immunoglobulin light chain junction region [Macaca mulatta]MOV73752.1 immunoglobulin light chain junction region [Macaca mulatta]MOV73774.1 immunoglobulin light chain junction region [Macaca mulatta]MOV74055.1 immunoglobulin light chain junction region [Macaca mulatta]
DYYCSSYAGTSTWVF